MNQFNTAKRIAKAISLAAFVCAGAFHPAHADSAPAAFGLSIPPRDMACFDVFFGSIRNNGSCGTAPKKWEMQLPVRSPQQHVVHLFTSFDGFGNCEAFTTDRHSVPLTGIQVSVTPEGGSFRRRFENLPINWGRTLSVSCFVPVHGVIKTVGWEGVGLAL